MTTIISMEMLTDRARNQLSPWGVEEVNFSEADISSATTLLAWPSQVSDRLISGMQNLQNIQFFSAGVEDVPFRSIPNKIRLYSNARGYNESVVEHTWALILSLARAIGRRDKSESYPLSGRTLTILGCGGIGSGVGALARAFNMKVVGLSRSFYNPTVFDIRYFSLHSDLEKALKEADVIVMALPRNKFTINLLTYERLKQTKPNVILVNVSRAELIDEASIYKILVDRPNVRFGTDVFWENNEKEQFGQAFSKLENFVYTEHKAGFKANQEAKEIAFLSAAENVRRLIETGNANNEIRRDDYV